MSSNNHTIPANLKLALTVKEATEYQRCIIHPVRKILRYVGEKEKNLCKQFKKHISHTK